MGGIGASRRGARNAYVNFGQVQAELIEPTDQAGLQGHQCVMDHVGYVVSDIGAVITDCRNRGFRFDGEEAITLLADLDAGATGAMTGGGYPDGIRRIFDAFHAGDRETAVLEYGRWLPLINYENRQGGILTAYEVSGLDLASAGLVVLSACDTGTGLKLRGQEVQGLRWGFRAAGARALVTSLWRSNDVATSRMMRSFYEALVSEDLKADALRGAEALRRAKLAQLASETRLGIRRPLIWANFIFSGVL
ncbi:MAG: CHAT domain-containing protein [Myxococcales bacterium]|nr:CHAT domain-containing protein [Myxococcales bacterium]